MVGEIGFEPTTPWTQTKCATKLRHSPTHVKQAISCSSYGWRILPIQPFIVKHFLLLKTLFLRMSKIRAGIAGFLINIAKRFVSH